MHLLHLLLPLLTPCLATPLPQSGDGPPSIPTPTTLLPSALWIRAVTAPNYHKYLQTKPANVPGPAVLDSHTTAGQFNIEAGQLVNKASTPPLYMWVEEPADKASPPRTLATWFNTTRNPFGTFAFQGDTLAWSDPSVRRQNVAAWLVCAGQRLFVNTGAYAYQTPSGCADQTVSGSLSFVMICAGGMGWRVGFGVMEGRVSGNAKRKKGGMSCSVWK